MAKRARKKSAVKARKSKPAKARTRTKVRAKTRSKSLAKMKPARRTRQAPTPRGIVDRVTSAIHAVVDTVKEAEALRHRMQPPGGSES